MWGFIVLSLQLRVQRWIERWTQRYYHVIMWFIFHYIVLRLPYRLLTFLWSAVLPLCLIKGLISTTQFHSLFSVAEHPKYPPPYLSQTLPGCHFHRRVNINTVQNQTVLPVWGLSPDKHKQTISYSYRLQDNPPGTPSKQRRMSCEV